jgi:8-oxo-dGTP diphosphatase
MRERIAELVASIDPIDDAERRHRADTLAWIRTGAPLFRIASPATPPMHLVAYFVLVDVERRALLLVDHLKAGLWLPSGGHVEPEEHPGDTVRREIVEELRVEAEFIVEEPLFLTVTTTVASTAGHTDVSLWYALRGDVERDYWFDASECSTVRWFVFDDLPTGRCDPHLSRFVAKLRSVLATESAGD